LVVFLTDFGAVALTFFAEVAALVFFLRIAAFPVFAIKTSSTYSRTMI
jgi:hypothetical protein